MNKLIRLFIYIVLVLIKYISFDWAMKIRNISYSYLLKEMGKKCNICDAVTIYNPKNIKLGENVSVHEYSLFGGEGNITIGNKVSIGSHCLIVSASHKFDRIDIPIKDQGVIPQDITIGNNVWIGGQVTILGNSNIGNNTIIGAGSVVNSNIPDNVIAVGNPCKIIRNR